MLDRRASVVGRRETRQGRDLVGGRRPVEQPEPGPSGDLAAFRPVVELACVDPEHIPRGRRVAHQAFATTGIAPCLPALSAARLHGDRLLGPVVEQVGVGAVGAPIGTVSP